MFYDCVQCEFDSLCFVGCVFGYLFVFLLFDSVVG